MKFGRLIKVGRFRGDPEAVIYVVAEADPVAAMDLVRVKAEAAHDLEDLGRVTSALLEALNLPPGGMART
jgi:hypothetical protein